MIARKKKELLQFIEQQTMGPGAIEGRLVRLVNIKSETIYDILNAPPAKYYCTGILFPRNGEDLSLILPEEETETEDLSDEEEPQASVIGDEEISTGNQTFPASMGITVALTEETAWNDLTIEFSFRKYRKLSPTEARKEVGLRIDMDVAEFNRLAALYGFLDVIKVVQSNNVSYVMFSDSIPQQEIYRRLVVVFGDQGNVFRNTLNVVPIFDKKAFEGLAVNQVRARLVRRVKENQEVENSKMILNLINSYVQFKAHIQNLGHLVRDDVWEGVQHKILAEKPNEELLLPAGIFSKFLNKTQVLSVFNENEGILNVNYLLTSDRRNPLNRLKYLKIQLVNDSLPIKPTEDRFYSVDNKEVNTRSFFGISINVKSNKIAAYNRIIRNKIDHADELTKFIYRDFKAYGTGHGCSINWNEQLSTVSSTYLPYHESPDVESTPRLKGSMIVDKEKQVALPQPYFNDDSFLEIQNLSTLSNVKSPEVIASLGQLIDGYDRWIKDKGLQSATSQEPHLHEELVEKCKSDSSRMRDNLNLLKSDERLLLIFRYMNTAMLMQMLHGKVQDHNLPNKKTYNLDYYKSKRFLINGNAPKWRPFQLAFILLNIDGIFAPSPKTRNTVDLIWFPTGGGKTEAYLSLIALCILYRRIFHGDAGAGTSVIMRYTLRLLALQQFQRATLLIMALELLRRWQLPDLPLGQSPITIGLWTGVGLTTNNFAALKEQVKEIASNVQSILPTEETPRINGLTHQNCPWCQASLVDRSGGLSRINYFIDSHRSYLFCVNPACIFSQDENNATSEPIPIMTCDEEIYLRPPSLLFGTVDKFAALGHRVSEDPMIDSRRLFGNPQSNWDGKQSPIPPDMIIQDELHLISGPLGSATALVEIAIQELCMRTVSGERYGAKIISSTATIRNSQEQVTDLYGKMVNVFPKPGPEADDSFFSFYKRTCLDQDPSKTRYESKRAYLGILPTGRTHMWTQLRLTSICLVHRIIFHVQNKDQNTKELLTALDSYHTVLSYFNSLKELGKTDSQVNTYLAQEVRRVYKNVLYPDWIFEIAYTENINKEELTGRLSGDEVKQSLLKIERKLKSDQNSAKKERPPDFVMATNMISVGLDISRLNTMIVNGMPRNISEYIQATSRVAREFPGLVITVHHPYRSRDVSHFEKFVEFHQKFYGHVEPISITPLARKTLDKFLSLYIAILTRHSFPTLAIRSAVTEISDSKTRENLRKFLLSVIERRNVSKEKVDLVREWINTAIDHWYEWVLNNPDKTLYYEYLNQKAPLDGQAKLYQTPYIDRFNKLQEKWYVPHSLRSVEEGTVINIKPA